MMRGILESEWLQNERTITDELIPLYGKIKTREKYDIWIIKGSLNIISKFREMTKNCSQEMLIAFPFIQEEFLMDFYQLLHPLTGGEVKVCLMVSRGLNEKTYKILSRIGEVRYRTKMFGGGAISDGRDVLLLFSDERGQITAIWSDHPGLAGLAKDYFNYLWKESEQGRS